MYVRCGYSGRQPGMRFREVVAAAAPTFIHVVGAVRQWVPFIRAGREAEGFGAFEAGVWIKRYWLITFVLVYICERCCLPNALLY